MIAEATIKRNGTTFKWHKGLDAYQQAKIE